MRIQFHKITPALQPYIKLICTMYCDKDADTTHIRVLPDTCVELFVNYSTSPTAIIEHQLHTRSILTARMSRPTDVQMRKGAGCLAVCFHPGMAYNFFNVPMHMLSDATVALSDLWEDTATEIEDQLGAANDDRTRADLIQKYLLKTLRHHPQYAPITFCIQQIQRSDDLASVKHLTDATGITQRHLSRKFQQYIGLSPKEYLRVSRFIGSVQLLKKFPARSLTAIAYDSGYYDQSHFIRDYKTYSGYTPGELIHAKHVY